MNQLLGANHVPPKLLGNGLVSEANPENRYLTQKVFDHGQTDTGLLGRARTR